MQCGARQAEVNGLHRVYAQFKATLNMHAGQWFLIFRRGIVILSSLVGRDHAGRRLHMGTPVLDKGIAGTKKDDT